jgi:V8-like Glu-specific endopeptidase
MVQRVRSPRVLRFIVAALVVFALLGSDGDHDLHSASASMTMADASGLLPTAASFHGVPTVGPIFRSGLSMPHSCTASVIASRHHDMMLTAAHCVFGSTKGWQIAPGYDNGKTPYGVWTVAAAYVSPAWLANHDNQHDYAILRIEDKQLNGRREGIQDVTGANVLAAAPHPGDDVTIIAYNGQDNGPVQCTVPAYYNGPYPAFDCHDYRGGSSGSPWLHDGTVVGLIGGLYAGGLTEQTSYSSRFGADIDNLLQRANEEGPGDCVRPRASNDC